MSAQEYRRLLEALGYSQEHFAVLVGASKRTGQKWALSETRIPGSVALILRLLELRPEMKAVIESLGAPAPRTRAPSVAKTAKRKPKVA